MNSGAVQRPADLPDLLGVPLSPEQLRAACADAEPGLIVAGAGSGKTTVMAARVVWLVGTGQAAAAEVLGLTFTNKAAAELAQRIRSALRRLSPQYREHADDVVVSTYHAFAGALLREFGLLIGVEPSAELMSPVRQRQLAMQVVAAADVDPRHLAKAPADVAAAVLSLDSLLADNDVAAERARRVRRRVADRTGRHGSGSSGPGSAWRPPRRRAASSPPSCRAIATPSGSAS